MTRSAHQRVVIVTTAHDPRDGRLTRHALTLRQAGAEVDIRRTVAGPRWKRFLVGPFTVFRAVAGAHVAIFPDPELFITGPLAARLRRIRPVLDVHEDYRLVARNRVWIPTAAAALFGLIAHVHRLVGSRLAATTVVAAPGLARPGDVVVDNMPQPALFGVAEIRTARGVYVGDVTLARGARHIADLVRTVPRLEVDLVGPVSPEARHIVVDPAVRDRIHIHGRRPYLESWEIARSALFGISLLEDTPAYRQTIPSKVWEYMASGLAVLASDLPAQSSLVRRAGCGVAVQPGLAADAVVRWLANPEEAIALGRAGRRWIEQRTPGDQALYEAVLEPSTP